MRKTLLTLALLGMAFGLCGQGVKISQYPNTNRLGPNQLFIVTAGGTNMNVKKSDMPAAIDAVADSAGKSTNQFLYFNDVGVGQFYVFDSFGVPQLQLQFGAPDVMGFGMLVYDPQTALAEFWSFLTNGHPNRVMREKDFTNVVMGGASRPLYQATPVALSNEVSSARADAIVGFQNNSNRLNAAANTNSPTPFANGITVSNVWDRNNVKWWGAKGDIAVYTDDTAAIQACADYAQSSGTKLVHFPSGFYRLTTNINVTNGITIHGDNMDSTQLIQTDTNYSVFVVWASGNYASNFVSISDLKIEYSFPGAVGTAAILATNQVGINASIRRIFIKNAWEGIRIADCYDSAIESCFAYTCASNGFHLSGWCTGSALRNNQAYQCYGNGYQIDLGSYLTLDANASDDNRGWGYKGQLENCWVAGGAEKNWTGGLFLSSGVHSTFRLHVTAYTNAEPIVLDACDGNTFLNPAIYSTNELVFAIRSTNTTAGKRTLILGDHYFSLSNAVLGSTVSSITPSNEFSFMGSDRIIVAGPVGIGTNSPQAALHTVGNGSIDKLQIWGTTAKDAVASLNTNGTLNLSNVTILGVQGSAGQVLTSTGTGIAYSNPPAGGSFDLHNYGSNQPAGFVGLLGPSNSTAALLKTLSQGANVTLTDNGTNISIAASASSGISSNGSAVIEAGSFTGTNVIATNGYFAVLQAAAQTNDTTTVTNLFAQQAFFTGFTVTNLTNVAYGSMGTMLVNTNLTVLGTATANSLVSTSAAFYGPALSYSASASNAPAENELPTAKWVRGLFNNGTILYVSTNQTVATNTDEAHIVYAFTNTIPATERRHYPAVNAGEYIGSVVTSNTFTFLQGPILVHSYLEATNGTGGPTVTLHPEIYYSYDRTNWYGDYTANNQTIATGTNLYEWVVSFPAITSTNSTGFYIERRFKVGAATGSTHPGIVVHIGTNNISGVNDASHISFSGPSSAAGNAYLANDQTFTGTNDFGATKLKIGGTNVTTLMGNYADTKQAGSAVLTNAAGNPYTGWTNKLTITKYATNAAWNVEMPEKGNAVAITNTLGGSTANVWLTNVVDGGWFVVDIVADGTARTVSITNASGLTLDVINTNGFSVTTLPQIPITANKIGTVCGRAFIRAGTTNVRLWANVQQ